MSRADKNTQRRLCVSFLLDAHWSRIIKISAFSETKAAQCCDWCDDKYQRISSSPRHSQGVLQRLPWHSQYHWSYKYFSNNYLFCSTIIFIKLQTNTQSVLEYPNIWVQPYSDQFRWDEIFLNIMQFEMISSPQSACYISLIGERKWNCCDLLVFLIRSAVWREKRGHVSCLAESCFVIYHKPELRCHGVMLSPL